MGVASVPSAMLAGATSSGSHALTKYLGRTKNFKASILQVPGNSFHFLDFASVSPLRMPMNGTLGKHNTDLELVGQM